MAAAGGKLEHGKLVFWTKPKSSEKDSHVPGVNDLGNMRPHVRGGRTKEIKAVMPVVQPTVEDLNSQGHKTQSLTNSTVSQDLLDTDLPQLVTLASGQGVSLRDLCVEDKKRVANLIRELARLGEEKEHAEKNLEEERKRYEEQILSLVEQQEQLLKDYEVQRSLVEYQTYILKLQQQQKRQKQQEQCQLQAHLPVQQNQQHIPQPLQKVSNSYDVTTSARYTENVGHQHRVQGPLSNIPETREDVYSGVRNEEWQRNLYMNNATENMKVENCSTEVNPSTSLPVELRNAGLDLQRPFTAIIDRELAYQRQLLAATVDSTSRDFPAVKTVSAVETTRKAKSPRQNTEIFLHKAARAGHQNQDVLHTHQIDLVSQPHNHLVMQGTGYSEYPHLPADKTEIFARFMQSQGKVPDSGREQQTNQHNSNNAASVTHNPTVHPAGDCGVKVIESDHELARKQGLRAPRVKKRKPPASYGPIHAPIMSSTQKSSEFGDCLSVNSSLHVAVRQQMPRLVDEEVDHEEDGENCVEGKHYHHHVDIKKGQNNHMKMLHKDMKKKKQHDRQREKHFVADADGEIVDKYKQLSAIERKTQLLKQRSLLLEEQIRLKKILTEQQQQLQINRQVISPTQQTSLEKDDRVHVEMSLAKLEQEVARKEQELLHERQRLARKRQEYKEPDGSGHRQKQQTRTSNTGEVKDSDIQAETVLLTVGTDRIPGNVRDASIRYQSPKVKDIVKKLDYSLNSDTESEASVHQESLQHSTPAGRGRVVKDTHSTPPASSTVNTIVPQVTSLPQRTDASTSVSFAHMSSVPSESPSRRLKCSTGTEMTPRNSTSNIRAGSEPSQQTLDGERQKMSLDGRDRTYTKDHGVILLGEKVLSDMEVINLLSELTPVSKSQPGHMSRSLSKVTNQHNVSLKSVPPRHGSQQPSSKNNSPILIDKFHHVEDNYTPRWNPPAKSKPAHLQPETDAVLELFEVKRPLRNPTGRQQHLKDVLCQELATDSGHRLCASSRQLDILKDMCDAGSEDNEEHAMLDEEVSVEKVIQILNFSNREKMKTPQRSADVSVANVTTEAVVDDNSDVSDEAEDRILEEVFFVRL